MGTSADPSVPPAQVERTIVTEVNVPEGDTMVIGGITTDIQGESRNQVPFLGDLPILGPLFRSDADTQRRTTLYFFVTPHILEDEDFADLAALSYEKKLEAAEIIGGDRITEIDPDFPAAGAELGLGGFELPLYRSGRSTAGGGDPETGEANESTPR